jgi:hypothetical protein
VHVAASAAWITYDSPSRSMQYCLAVKSEWARGRV